MKSVKGKKVNLGIVLVIVSYIFFMLLNINVRNSDISLEVYYKEMPNENVVIFYDTGEGYSENEKLIAKKIEELVYEFKFNNVTIEKIQQMRFDPSYLQKETNICKIVWKNDGQEIEIFPSDLFEYITNANELSAEEFNDSMKFTTMNYFVYFNLNKEFIRRGTRIQIKLSKIIQNCILPCIFVSMISFLCSIFWGRCNITMRKDKMTRGILILLSLILTMYYIKYVYNNVSIFFESDTIECIISLVIITIIAMLLGFINISLIDSFRENTDGKKVVSVYPIVWYGTIVFGNCFIYKCMIYKLVYNYKLKKVIIAVLSNFFEPKYIINVIMIFSCLLFIAGCLGRKLGSIIFQIVYLIFIVGNFIKIKYHNSLLTPLDFWQISDLIRISNAFVNLKCMIIIGVALCTLIMGLLIIFRKSICRSLKPNPNIFVLLISSFLLFGGSYLIWNNKLDCMGFDYMTYVDSFTNEKVNGEFVFLLNNIKQIKDVMPNKPKEYSKEYMDKLSTEFSMLEKKSSLKQKDTDVIVIMCESLFDIDRLDGVKFSSEVEPTIHSMQTNSLISPRYGGYTAAVEFEMLTGMSLAFFPDGLMPYTTFFNDSSKKIPSIAQEFKKNGYETIAVHPNIRNFYNRDVAYSELGFDEYYSINDFDAQAEDYTLAGYLNDSAFGERIIEELEKNDNPKFIFAVSIEAHYMTKQKYEKHSIGVESELLTEQQIFELEEMAESYKHTDEMIKEIKEYIDSTDRNTILYIFGDHLPPLTTFHNIEYTKDINNKYSTVLLAYSNFMDIDLGNENITPNVLPALILKDSGIEYSDYFDYIYYFSESYPVLHKEYVDINNNDFDIYRIMQYDLLFGKNYLVN